MTTPQHPLDVLDTIAADVLSTIPCDDCGLPIDHLRKPWYPMPDDGSLCHRCGRARGLTGVIHPETVQAPAEDQGPHDDATKTEGTGLPQSLAERRAHKSGRRADDIWPTAAEFEAFADLLDRNGITPEAIAEHIAAEQAGLAEGTVKPIRRR